ncbi:uncharacterized protein EV154DRAFT_571402 [Mucor mucedo]|uniref:uncharacterized protein n=1 Tax=Mucor mucedo TaxID=29922 RepID=UPI0022206F5C|nr:uncharacterized protein EV154DRAFT_571402 [Mucor mucedo]KAI7868381.1 hypothetical protein EV154DRAFT_571402 [Mucor mucedo]
MSDQLNRNTGGDPFNNDDADKIIDRTKITGDDIKRGLTTFEAKCQHLCIGFSRLVASFPLAANAFLAARVPLVSGAFLAAGAWLATGNPLNARSLFTKPVSTALSSSFYISFVGTFSKEPLFFSRHSFGEDSFGQPSSVKIPATDVASSPLVAPSKTQPANRTLFVSSAYNGLLDSFSFDDVGSYHAVDHDNNVNSGINAGYVCGAGGVGCDGGRFMGRDCRAVSRAGTAQPEFQTADRSRVDPDCAMRHKRIKIDFSYVVATQFIQYTTGNTVDVLRYLQQHQV